MNATFIVLCLLPMALGYKYFQLRIPNGDRIPDPSVKNALWRGVGHLNRDGGGPRNVFGLDFAANGFVS